MLLCNNCGKENKDSSKFCTGCGTNMLTSIQRVLQNESIPYKKTENDESLCAKCGSRNKEGAKFCVKCGNSFAPLVQQIQQQGTTLIPKITNNEFLCGQCGKQNKEGAKFCITCGNSLGASIQDVIAHQENISIEESPSNKENEIYQNNVPDELSVSNIETILINEDKHERVQIRSTEKLIVNNVTPITVDQSLNLNKCKEYPVEHMLPLKDDAEIKIYMPVEKGEIAEDNIENPLPDAIPVFEESYLQNSKKKRNRVIVWTACILAVTGLGAFFFFGNTFDKSKKISINSSYDTISKTLIKSTDTFIPVTNNDSIKINEITKTNTIVQTPNELSTSKHDNFKYLSLNQIKNDLLNKSVCEGVTYTGIDQKLRIIGNFPDVSYQNKLDLYDGVTIKINFEDISGNKNCIIEVFYKKRENRFDFITHAEK